MIVTIPMIAAIAEKSAQRSQRSYANYTGTIATIVIAGIELGSISAMVAIESDREF